LHILPVFGYSGITKDLQKALAIFEEDDIKGALEPPEKELEELKIRHQEALSNQVKSLQQYQIITTMLALVLELPIYSERWSDRLEKTTNRTYRVTYVSTIKSKAPSQISWDKFMLLANSKYFPIGLVVNTSLCKNFEMLPLNLIALI
jgi:hypothetical protein